MDKFGDYPSNEANKDKPKYVHITLLIYRTGKPACSRKVPLVICQPATANGLNGADLLDRLTPSCWSVAPMLIAEHEEAEILRHARLRTHAPQRAHGFSIRWLFAMLGWRDVCGRRD
jgi:hypothetical protein